MKYGETLRQRSIPEWSHHNIDYDDIKLFIKEQTTRGTGKTVFIPGHGHDQLVDFEDTLFAILTDQHQRIDLFVKSKAGEIRRRIDHSKKHVRQFAARVSSTPDHRIAVRRLERYGRLENDIVKAGDEIKSLARFTSTQRTAFRKILKKFKKWTGSTHLEDRFREDVLGAPKSFTGLDLGPLLDDYSITLQEVRALYESRTPRHAATAASPEALEVVGSSMVTRLQAAADSGSKVEFDTAMATVPLGEGGMLASYFIHPEYVVELQMLLLQHSKFVSSRSRSNSINSPIASSPKPDCPPDFFSLTADDADRFAREQNALTVNEREQDRGSTSQRARLCARWNLEEEAIVSARADNGRMRCATVKKKHVDAFFDKSASYPLNKAGDSLTELDSRVKELRRDVERHANMRPLYMLSACRSRFMGLVNTAKGASFATLDTGLAVQKAGTANKGSEKADFPFALLLVRQEGVVAGGLLPALEHSHLVERVRGFSMEYHAAWEACKSSSHIPPPFWLPILSRDIRKLPPPAIGRTHTRAEVGSEANSGTHGSTSVGSERGTTDSATAVETSGNTSITISDNHMTDSVLQPSRKKRRRQFPETHVVPPQQKYWSEYDHPESGSDAGDDYVLYIDPNEDSVLDRWLDKLGHFFARLPAAKATAPGSPATLNDDDETSSTDEGSVLQPRAKSYGTLSTPSASTSRYSRTWQRIPTDGRSRALPHLTATCLVASMVILTVAYLLALTGRHRYASTVDAGVVFATASSLIFALVGFASLLRRPRVSAFTWAFTSAVLLLDVISAGGLLAWMIGEL